MKSKLELLRRFHAEEGIPFDEKSVQPTFPPARSKEEYEENLRSWTRRSAEMLRRAEAENALAAAHRTEQPPARSFVYYVQAGESGPIKIGVAKDVDERMRGLQTGCPVRLRLLAREPGGVAKESKRHHRFRALRELGEWFRPGAELLSFIAGLRAI